MYITVTLIIRSELIDLMDLKPNVWLAASLVSAIPHPWEHRLVVEGAADLTVRYLYIDKRLSRPICHQLLVISQVQKSRLAHQTSGHCQNRYLDQKCAADGHTRDFAGEVLTDSWSVGKAGCYAPSDAKVVTNAFVVVRTTVKVFLFVVIRRSIWPWPLIVIKVKAPFIFVDNHLK